MNRRRPERPAAHRKQGAPKSGRPKERSGHRNADRSAEPSRERDRARWVVGLHSVEEALKIRPRAIRELWLRADWSSSQQLRELQEQALSKRIQVREKSSGQLDQVGLGNQGVAAALTETPEVNWEKLADSERSVVLILDGIEDPQNLGAMMRTAWLMGVDALFIPPDRAVGITPTVCKVASGGAEHVPVETDSLHSVMEQLKKHGFWIYGLAEAGTRPPWDFKLPPKIAWVVGAEGAGMRKPTEKACDDLVRLPQVPTGSSYNAAVACAMALVETARQLGKP